MDPSITDRFAGGELLVLLDGDAARQPALLMARAAAVGPEAMADLVRYTSGFVTVALPAARCDELGLPAQAHDPLSCVRPVAAVATDARVGVSTGISAADRCTTVRVLADPLSLPSDLCRPGHVVPLRVPLGAPRDVDPKGRRILAVMDLCASLDGVPAVASSVLVAESGEVLRYDEAVRFAAVRGYPVLHASDIPAAGGVPSVDGLAS